MSFLKYSLLLVSASKSWNEWFLSLSAAGRDLTEAFPVTATSSINAARRALAERRYDLIVINAPLPDGFGARLAVDACLHSESGVMLLVSCEFYEEICAKTLTSGVIVTEKPTDARTLEQSLRTLCAVRERLRMSEKKRASVEEKIEEIRLVNRAKWRLIERLGMTEADAHRYIEKQAMNQRVSRRKVAESILMTYQ